MAPRGALILTRTTARCLPLRYNSTAWCRDRSIVLLTFLSLRRTLSSTGGVEFFIVEVDGAFSHELLQCWSRPQALECLSPTIFSSGRASNICL